MELFRLFGKIAVDNTEAKKAIDDTTKKAKDGSKEQSSAFEKIGSVALKVGKAILGEAGAEAVVPLKNNREWLTQVARDLNELQGDQQIDLDDVLRKLDTIIRMLEKMIERKIYLDSNVLVGELAPEMNMKLGKIYSRENRR